MGTFGNSSKPETATRRDVSAVNLGFLSQLVDLDIATHGRQSLPLLAAFLIKKRRDRHISADTGQKFDVAELLALWHDQKCQTRTSGMAKVMVKMAVSDLRKRLQDKVTW